MVASTSSATDTTSSRTEGEESAYPVKQTLRFAQGDVVLGYPFAVRRSPFTVPCPPHRHHPDQGEAIIVGHLECDPVVAERQ